MKRLKKSYGVGVALAALAFVGLSPSAKAVLDLGGYTGPVTISMRSLDNGNLYAPDGSVAVPVINGAGFDTWGIFQVTLIDGNGNDLYASNDSDFKLWGLFEADDIAVASSGTVQTVSTAGLTISIYAIPDGANVYNIAPGGGGLQVVPSANHTAPGVFTGITDVGGDLVLSLSGHAGNFAFDVDDNPGGLLTELLTTFDASNNTGSGGAFLDVTGLGSSDSVFDTNLGVGGSDIELQFIASQTVGWFTSQTPGDWLLGDVDPAEATVIPEPTTALAGLGCILPVLGSFLRRRRASTAA